MALRKLTANDRRNTGCADGTATRRTAKNTGDVQPTDPIAYAKPTMTGSLFDGWARASRKGFTREG